MCVCVHAHSVLGRGQGNHISGQTCASQRTILWSQFFFFTFLGVQDSNSVHQSCSANAYLLSHLVYPRFSSSFFFFNSSLIHYCPTSVSPPAIPSSLPTSPLHQIHPHPGFHLFLPLILSTSQKSCHICRCLVVFRYSLSSLRKVLALVTSNSFIRLLLKSYHLYSLIFNILTWIRP